MYRCLNFLPQYLLYEEFADERKEISHSSLLFFKLQILDLALFLKRILLFEIM